MYSVGGACRTRVNRVLAKKFTTPLLAEEFYDTEDKSKEVPSNSPASTGDDSKDKSEHIPSISPSSAGNDSNGGRQGSSQPSSSASIPIESLDTLELVSHKISCIYPDQQLKFIEELFARYCSSLSLSLPPDFLSYSVKAMQQLQASNRSNFLFGLAKGLGTQRSHGTDSVFPTKQVIAGLIEYSINFFNASTVAQASTLFN